VSRELPQGDQVARRLVEWLQTQLPNVDAVRIEGLERVDFGHSAEMMVLTVVTARGEHEERRDVVLRLRPPPPALLEPYDLTRQFDILRALEHTPVRVPRALWLEDSGDVLGREFLVMERVAGDVYEMETPDRSEPGIRRMCESMAEQLGEIHAVELGSVDLSFLGDGHDHLDRELDHWASEMHRVQRGPLPALERLLQALRESKPEPSERITLVHGDAKPGNFAFLGDDVSAVFDWEMTTIGDPLTDIGWMELLWMQPVGLTSHPSALTIDEFLERYAAVSGVTPVNRPWYRALNAYKMAVICLIGGMMFDSGSSDDLKLVVAAGGVPILPILGLADLGIHETYDTGPVEIRKERIREVKGAAQNQVHQG
jgi:aminoglycoside phosphotransferase (APT) family kinase protein